MASHFASRPRKRIRRAQRKRALTAKKRADNRLYFDFLSPEANENVVRCLSSAPGAQDWSCFVKEKDIATIYNAAGDLGKFASSRFTCILISAGDDDVPEYNDNWIEISDASIGEDVLMRGAATFKKIYVDSSFAKRVLTSDMLDKLSDKCTSIESLYLPSEGGRAWLERFGNRLRTLEFTSESPRKSIVAIPYCSNIRELTLKEVSKSCVARTNIWEKIGKTLEILSIKFKFSGEEQIRNIEKYCRKLKHIDICGLYNMGALSKCLASYENQLEYAEILSSNMNTEQLRGVVAKCTKGRFKLVFEEYIDHEYLNILGKQLKNVEIGRINKRIDLRSAWNLCANLEDLLVHEPTRLRDVEALLASPKLFLKQIILDLHKKDGNVKSVMDAFATGGVTTLETVWLKCFTPPSKAFDKLVDTNKALTNVSLLLIPEVNVIISEVENPPPIPHREIREIAECFLRSKSIKRLVVQDYYNEDEDGGEKIDEVEELCRGENRHRRIHVSLLAYRYM